MMMIRVASPKGSLAPHNTFEDVMNNVERRAECDRSRYFREGGRLRPLIDESARTGVE
jgi:hypothetical protein